MLENNVSLTSNLYSDRNKAKNIDEVIIFDELPRKLRVQFNFILKGVCPLINFLAF